MSEETPAERAAEVLIEHSVIPRNRHDRHVRTRRAVLIRVRRAQKQERET